MQALAGSPSRWYRASISSIGVTTGARSGDMSGAELDPDDLELITRFIDALVTKPASKNLTNTIN